LSNIALQNLSSALVTNTPEYSAMLQNINAVLPAALKSATNFYKGQSQYNQAVLDVTTLTPLRSMYQALAEIEKARSALQENQIKLQKADIERRRKEAKLAETTDPFDKELLEIEIFEINVQRANSQNYMNGGIRKLNFFLNQYNNMLEKIGKTEVTEEDFEREERRHHVMTCFKQALCAARSRNGVIDEGNFIYMFDIGINAAHAQAELIAYLTVEEDMLSRGELPTHQMVLEWLGNCADKFQDCVDTVAEYRGYTLLDKQSLASVLKLAE
jgi:hypothetical protein